jgi:phage shock protein C
MRSSGPDSKEVINVAANQRTLHKGESRIIGGVCSGLAEYFGVEPVFVRVAFVLLAIVPAGAGVLLYLLLWLLMPEPGSSSEDGADVVRSGARSIGKDIHRIGEQLKASGSSAR